MGQIFNKLNPPMSLQSTGENIGDLEYNDGIGVAQSSEDSTKQEVYHEEFSKGSSESNTKLAAFNINKWGHITYINKDFSYAQLPSVTTADNDKKLLVRINELGKKEWFASKMPSGVRRLPYLWQKINGVDTPVTGFIVDTNWTKKDDSYIFYDKNQNELIFTEADRESTKTYYDKLFQAEWVYERIPHNDNNKKYKSVICNGNAYIFSNGAVKIFNFDPLVWGFYNNTKWRDTNPYSPSTNGKINTESVLTKGKNQLKEGIWAQLQLINNNNKGWDFYIPYISEIQKVDLTWGKINGSLNGLDYVLSNSLGRWTSSWCFTASTVLYKSTMAYGLNGKWYSDNIERTENVYSIYFCDF